MNKILLTSGSMSPHPDILGFSQGRIGRIQRTKVVSLSSALGSECIIDWNELYFNGSHVSYKFVSHKKVQHEMKEKVVVFYKRRFFRPTYYVGMVEGKRYFLAVAKGVFKRKLEFVGKDSIDNDFGGGFSECLALLCWWMTYRD